MPQDSPAAAQFPLAGAPGRHLPGLEGGAARARLQREYGDVAYFRLGPLSCYQLTHPDHIQEVLVRQAKKFRKWGPD